MKGLLLKDFYMTVQYCKIFLLFEIMFWLVAFFVEDSVLFLLYPTLMAGLIPMTLLSYDERDRWDKYSDALPYTRSQRVSAKYLIGFLFGAVGLAVSIAVGAARMLYRNNFSLSELLVVCTLVLIAGLIGPVFLLPCIFKFGVQKGRIAFYVVIGLACALAASMAGSGFDTEIPGASLPGLGLAAGVLCLLYPLSWRLSVLFYQRREM